MKKKKIRKPINNVYFYFILFLFIVIISSLVFIFSNSNFDIIKDFWGWWVVFAFLFILFVFFIYKFVVNIYKNKKQKTKNMFNNKSMIKKEY